MQSRIPVFAAIAAATALVISACTGGGGGGGDAADESPVRGGSITIGVDAETPGWYPPNGLIGAAGRIVNRLIYGSLTAGTPDGSYQPYLAESVTPNDDFTEWTIALREGMTFQDGSAFDSEAVKASMEAVIDPESAVGASFGWVTGIDAPDPETVVITADAPRATVPQVLSGPLGQIVSKEAVDAIGVDAFNSAPVGAGPYKMTEWVRDDHLTLEKVPDFFQDDIGWADEIIIKPIPDAAARAAALSAGDIDVTFTGVPTDIEAFKNDASVTVNEVPLGVDMFFMNGAKAPFDDIRIREAVTIGVDRDELTTLVWGGIGKPATGPFQSDNPFYDSSLPAIGYDVDAATKLVDEYKEDKGLTEVSVVLTNYPGQDILDAAMKSQLEKIGLTVEVRPASDANAHNIEMIQGDFDLGGFTFPGFLDPDYEVTRFFPSDSFLNVNRIMSPELDAAIVAGRSTTDFDERKAAYDTVQEVVTQNYAGLYLHEFTFGIVSRSDIGGYGQGTVPGSDARTLGEYYSPILGDELFRRAG